MSLFGLGLATALWNNPAHNEGSNKDPSTSPPIGDKRKVTTSKSSPSPNSNSGNATRSLTAPPTSNSQANPATRTVTPLAATSLTTPAPAKPATGTLPPGAKPSTPSMDGRVDPAKLFPAAPTGTAKAVADVAPKTLSLHSQRSKDQPTQSAAAPAAAPAPTATATPPTPQKPAPAAVVPPPPSNERNEKENKEAASKQSGTNPGAPPAAAAASAVPVQPPVKEKVELAPIPTAIQDLLTGWIKGGALEELTTKERVERLKVECYDRDDEVEAIANQISCANKNCVIVQAKPGSGKTTLMNHIAARVMDGTAPEGFRNKRIFLINDPKKALEILQAVDKSFSEHCILFCDEVHQIFAKEAPNQPKIFGTADAEGLKPYIGDGRVTLVGFTDRAHGTWDNGFLDDPAWERRFYEIVLSDMSITAASKIMEKAKAGLEKKFERRLKRQLEITPEAILLSVKLADWLFPRQQFPDKVSHILEPACASKMRSTKPGIKVKITEDDILNYMTEKRRPKYDLKALKRGLAEIEVRSKLKYIPANSPLMEFCEDLTMRAATGDLQPAYGREKQMAQLIKTFSAGVSNNAVLHGPHGCGKTRIAYGFACKIARGEVPDHLKGMHVLLLDLAAFVGGTQYRGQLEKRIRDFLRSAKEHLGKFILFIDEFHMVIGAGAHKGGEHNHIANYFKTALADGHLPSVGMTNIPEAIKSDGAFARRFRFLEVPLFTPEETTDCMNKQKDYIESHYSQKLNRPFKVDAGAIEAAVRLGQVMPDENLPASAFKLLDLACGGVVAEACERLAEKELKEKAASGAAGEAVAKVAVDDPGVVVKKEHIEAAATEALGSAKKVVAPPKDDAKPPQLDPKALTDRITKKMMRQLPPGLSKVETLIRELVADSVSTELAAPGSEEAVAPKDAAKGAGVSLSPKSLIGRAIQEESSCFSFGLWIWDLMNRISEFFTSHFPCCGSREPENKSIPV